MKGIYLASGRAFHEGHDIIYQDLIEKRDIGGDMMEIDLTPYDYIIASPPCNYYSRANYRRDISEYSLKTKHLLPDILDKLIKLGKPFVVENVRNEKLFSKLGLFNRNCFIITHGRHTYFTNVMMDLSNIPQVYDFYKDDHNHTRRISSYCQGGYNVHQCIEAFLEYIGA